MRVVARTTRTACTSSGVISTHSYLKGAISNKWQKCTPHWALIVEMSFATALGSHGVQNLREKLFPSEDFPGKYNNDGTFKG